MGLAQLLLSNLQSLIAWQNNMGKEQVTIWKKQSLQIPKSRDANLFGCTRIYCIETFADILEQKDIISNLLNLKFSWKTLSDSVNEVGEGEWSTTIPVSEKTATTKQTIRSTVHMPALSFQWDINCIYMLFVLYSKSMSSTADSLDIRLPLWI